MVGAIYEGVRGGGRMKSTKHRDSYISDWTGATLVVVKLEPKLELSTLTLAPSSMKTASLHLHDEKKRRRGPGGGWRGACHLAVKKRPHASPIQSTQNLC